MNKLVFILIIFITTTISALENRVALIIGNNLYSDNISSLSNPVSDTTLITKQLKSAGFKTIHLKDASLKETNRAISKFKKELTQNSVGLFYFAGHGVEIDARNYLIPIDAKGESEDTLKRSSLAVDKLVRLFKESKNDLNIIILDACRDNPITPLKKRGLAPFVSPDGLFVAYSAQSGTKAQDGPKDGNSPFAVALAKNILSGDDIEAVFKHTRADVYRSTDGLQRPSTYSEILTPFYFAKKTRGIKRSKNQPSSVNFKRHKRFIEPQLILIPKGKLSKGHEDDFETSPVHKVEIEKDFYISAYETTFEEYDMFCANSGWQKPNDNGWGRGKQPVINVSYEDAQAYVKWLSKKSKKSYRLPSESEWEYIAKSGTNSNYGYGDDDGILPKFAWYEDNSNSSVKLIGTKKANSFGIHDMLGNIAEWTNDSFYAYDEASYRMKKNDSHEKVVRGGAYFNTYDELTTFRRVSLGKDQSNKYTGFRIVLDK